MKITLPKLLLFFQCLLPNTFALGEQIQLAVYLGWEGGLYLSPREIL